MDMEPKTGEKILTISASSSKFYKCNPTFHLRIPTRLSYPAHRKINCSVFIIAPAAFALLVKAPGRFIAPLIHFFAILIAP